jgi:hypothetical protein
MTTPGSSFGIESASELSLLRLLLDDPRVDPDDLDWSLILPAATRHGLLLRLAAWFDRRGECAPPQVAASIQLERDKLACVVSMVGQIDERCQERGVRHVFLKFAQQYPDLGRDVDLLVSCDCEVTGEVLTGRAASLRRQDLRCRLAGTVSYAIPECDTSVAVHHGRVGRLGEHERFARQILERPRRVSLGSVSFDAPTREDALLLLVLDRLYGRPTLRLRDAHWAITTMRSGVLDWDYLIATARAQNLIAGLGCYLDYVDQIHRQLFGRAVLPAEVRTRLAPGDWGQVAFESGCFRFPAARVTGRLYFAEFCTDLIQGRWEAASRLVWLPIVAAAAGYRRLAHPLVGGV